MAQGEILGLGRQKTKAKKKSLIDCVVTDEEVIVVMFLGRA